MTDMFLTLETDALDLEIAINRLDVYIESAYLFTEAKKEEKSGGEKKPGFFRSIFDKILRFFDDVMLAIKLAANKSVKPTDGQEPTSNDQNNAKLMKEIKGLNSDLNNGADMYRRLSGGEAVDADKVKDWIDDVEQKTTMSNKEAIKVGSDFLANHVFPILAAAKGKIRSIADLKSAVKKHYVEDNHGRALEDTILSGLGKISSKLCNLGRP